MDGFPEQLLDTGSTGVLAALVIWRIGFAIDRLTERIDQLLGVVRVQVTDHGIRLGNIERDAVVAGAYDGLNHGQ